MIYLEKNDNDRFFYRLILDSRYLFLLKIEMKLKEIDRTVHVAWSPAKIQEQNANANYLVAGTAAQQLDASFRLVYQKNKPLKNLFVFLLVQIPN